MSADRLASLCAPHMSGQFGEGVRAPVCRSVAIDRSIDLQVVLGRAARQRRCWAVPLCCSSTVMARWDGMVEPPAGVLPCSAPWWETGLECMRPRRRAGKESVRRALVLFRRESGTRYCGGLGRRRRLGAAPPPDDLKIDSTHPGGSCTAGNYPVMNCARGWRQTKT